MNANFEPIFRPGELPIIVMPNYDVKVHNVSFFLIACTLYGDIIMHHIEMQKERSSFKRR